ncbi:hypothetical protein HEP74_00195 [Xanthomonas sp. SS]|uniref:hypothetical protein n=1 Tax=Xanthomonas sp. SS TaxID=2724122 RepID=UPI00163AB0BB|nr:hypothetical protein [Xanthomonas sp. SS]QNH15077.1 hypothetical protein HEP74_00195 [Xanthomonas sp. SS]
MSVVGFGHPCRLRLLAERSARDNIEPIHRSHRVARVAHMSGSLERRCGSRFLLEGGVLDDASIAVHAGPAALPVSHA